MTATNVHRESYNLNEVIPTRARVLEADGTELDVADVTTVDVRVYDQSSAYPDETVYSLIGANPNLFLGKTYASGPYNLNFGYAMASTVFTRVAGHRYLVQFTMHTSAEGDLDIFHYADMIG